jgi:hypothetical protein
LRHSHEISFSRKENLEAQAIYSTDKLIDMKADSGIKLSFLSRIKIVVAVSHSYEVMLENGTQISINESAFNIGILPIS